MRSNKLRKTNRSKHLQEPKSLDFCKAQNKDIYEYEVRKETNSDPMYGRSKLLFKSFDPEKAMQYVKEHGLENDEKTSIREATYTCQRNYEKGFSLCSSYVWSPFYPAAFLAHLEERKKTLSNTEEIQEFERNG